MIQFHYHPSRNPAKVARFVEESGLPCLWPTPYM